MLTCTECDGLVMRTRFLCHLSRMIYAAGLTVLQHHQHHCAGGVLQPTSVEELEHPSKRVQGQCHATYTQAPPLPAPWQLRYVKCRSFVVNSMSCSNRCDFVNATATLLSQLLVNNSACRL